jgi:hypothetical protein
MLSYRKRTMRKMPPTTELAKLATELASISRRLRNRIKDIRKIEDEDVKRAQQAEEVLDRMTEGVKLNE